MNIFVAEDAKLKLEKDLQKNPEGVFRIGISGYTWCGPSFGIALDKQKEDDTVETVDNFKFTTTEDLKDSIRAVNIKLENSLFGKKIKVTCN